MQQTLYLVRHAQSNPSGFEPPAGWRLSATGLRQAEALADLLAPLGIEHVFSSPFLRSLATAAPFAGKHALEISVVGDLRERVLANEPGHDEQELWCRAWADFSFALPGCETSAAAQNRICGAVRAIAERQGGTSAVFTHGHVMALFLNAWQGSIGRKEAEALTNPDVLRVEWKGGVFVWDREFTLPGLAGITTDHRQTPREQSSKASP